jgi:putative SOS response-associated peptidase YedK
MCGKFRGRLKWRTIFAYSDLFAPATDAHGEEEAVYTPMQTLPVIIFVKETGKRHVVPMRWGFPQHQNYRIPQPIHARSDTIDELPVFHKAFRDGQRGIVVFQTFNEGEEATTSGGKPKTIQWTIDPQDGVPRGFAFLWRRFDIRDLPKPLLACVMVTVPANKLLRDSILQNDADPRMPAILAAEDWDAWLGEREASIDEVKATLKTVEGVNWKMAREQKKPSSKAKTPKEPPLNEPSLL